MYWTFDLYSFNNISDGSSVFIPEVSYNLADGLDISLFFGIPDGKGQQEFSSVQFGSLSMDFRIDVKL